TRVFRSDACLRRQSGVATTASTILLGSSGETKSGPPDCIIATRRVERRDWAVVSQSTSKFVEGRIADDRARAHTSAHALAQGSPVRGRPVASRDSIRYGGRFPRIAQRRARSWI